MAPDIPTARLGEVARIHSGATPSKKNPAYWEGDIPWVSAKDMKLLRLSDGEDHISEAGLANGSRLAPIGSTLILTRGMTLLNDVPICKVVKPLAYNQDLKALEPLDVIDGDYLTYVLLALKPILLNMVEQAGHGTGKLPTELLKALQIPLPALTEQRFIANILSALDDKIELNRRMNDTLEAMAQALFKEWFVDGQVSSSSSGLGSQRDHNTEWEEKTIGDLVELIMGQSPKGDTYNDQNIGLPLLNGAGDFREGFPEVSRFTSDPLRMSQGGDIVFTMRGTIGNLCIGDREYALGRCVSALKPKQPFMKWLIYFTLERGLSQLRNQAMGSVITGLSKVDINRVPVLVPDEETTNRFHEVVDPLMARRECNRIENRTLASLRDTLLPKLMRGEVRVKELINN